MVRYCTSLSLLSSWGSILYVSLGNSSGSMGSFLPFFERAILFNTLSGIHNIRPPLHHEVISSQEPLHPDVADVLDVRAISGLPRLRTRGGTGDVIVLIPAYSSMLGFFTWRAHALAFIFGKVLMNALLASKLPEAAD